MVKVWKSDKLYCIFVCLNFDGVGGGLDFYMYMYGWEVKCYL